MISTRIIPVATATEQELLVEITEGVCKPFCAISGVTPAASVAFTQGTVRVVDGNAIVPITATVTVVSPNCKSCGCAETQVFTEQFSLAFTATATNAVTLTPGTQVEVQPSSVKCCKARGVKITTTLTATIA